MTWRRSDPQCFESDKIAALTVPYLQGKFLDIGCGRTTVWPSAIGVDNGHHWGADSAGIHGDGTDLSMFSDGSMDAVFSSHLLEHFPRSQVSAVLKEWARVLKVGGYLVLYLPSANLYPRVGEDGANPDHKWDIFPGDVEAILRAGTVGWTQIECEERDGTNEYSLFLVFQKRKDQKFVVDLWQRNPGGKQRCLVIRYGAIGDAVQTASVLKALHKQGFFVTLNCKPETRDVLRYDPHVDEWLIQATDYVPNPQLGAYWLSLEERYDKIVNLCESVEGTLLTMPGRLTHAYPDETRRKLYGSVNYVERMHDIAGVPFEPDPRFYLSEAERAWVQRTKAEWLRGQRVPVVQFAVNGSSPHKVYPWSQIVMAWLLERTPCHVLMAADPGIGKQLQDGIVASLEASGADMKRVHAMAGDWTVRQALSFAVAGADCVVGPETGVLNAVAHETVPKVIYLSHSSHTNLTRDWANTAVLEPDVERAPCFPCHRLHSDWAYCPQNKQTQAAACASAIAPERVFEAVALALGARKSKVA